MTEREPTRGLRFDAWHLLRFVAAAAVAAALFVSSFSHVTYEVYGDPSQYFHELDLLRHDYLGTNLQALHAGDGSIQHIRLRTEGGFASLLWLCRSINLKLPFWINGVSNALLLLGLLFLVRQSLRDSRWGLLAGLVFLAAVFSNSQLAPRVWAMSRLYRDTPAHLLAVAGFLCAGFGTRREKRGLWIFLSGACIGLSAWFRMPDILFAAPVALLLILCRPWKHPLQSAQDLSLLGLGLAVGLLPLVLQTVLEGKALTQAGQIERMSMVKPGAGPRFHILNIPAVFPEALQALSDTFPKDRLTVLAALAGVAVLFSFRRAVPLLAASAAFLLFYACYTKIVPRYILPSFLFLAAVAAVGVIAPLDFLARRRTSDRRVEFLLTALVLAVGGLDLHLVLRSAGDLDAAEQVWQNASGVGQWVNGAPDRNTFITSDQNLKAWIRYFGKTPKKVLGWTWPETDEQAHAEMEPYLAAGQGVYFVNVAVNGVDRPSWWKDGILNHFDLGAAEGDLPYIEEGETVLFYPVTPRARLESTVPVAPPAGPTRLLYLPARALSGTNRWQTVELAWGGSTSSATAVIQAGPNVLSVSCDIPATGGAVVVRSASPLPSFVEAHAVDEAPWTIDFTRYDEVYSHSKWLDGENLSWRGFRLWERDWGGYDDEHKSRPEFALTRGGSIRLPACDADLRVRLYAAAILDKEQDLDEESAARLFNDLRWTVGGEPVTHFFVAGDPYSDGKYSLCELVAEAVVPASLLTANRGPDLALDWPADVPVTDIFLRHVQFAPAEPLPAPPASEPKKAEDALAWPLEHTPAWKERPVELIDDPSFSFAEPEASVRVDPDGANQFVMLSWYDRAGSRGAKRSLSVGCGDRRIARFGLDPGLEQGRVLVPVPRDPACRHLDVRFDAPARKGEGRVIFHAQTLKAVDGLICRQLSMDPDDPFACFLKDFWTERHYPDDRYYRWTTGDSSIHFPVIGKPHDTLIGLRVEGPPAAASPLRLDVMLNNQQVFATKIANEVGQTIELRVPSAHLRRGSNVLKLKSGTWRPSKVGLSDDDRTLGFKLMGVSWSVEP